MNTFEQMVINYMKDYDKDNAKLFIIAFINFNNSKSSQKFRDAIEKHFPQYVSLFDTIVLLK